MKNLLLSAGVAWGVCLFAAEPEVLPEHVAPGQAASAPAVRVDSPSAPSARVEEGRILEHLVQRDPAGRLLGWYRPGTPGAAYDHVVKLAARFVKDGTPLDPKTGLPLYFVSCSFNGPQFSSEAAFLAGQTWDDWMNNPACFFAGAVQSLALDCHAYTGDRGYIELVRRMLDHQLEFGTTPAGWPWARVPYASADPGNPVFAGATRWENAGMRGDGLHGIEPDKVGELGVGYVKFYQLTEDTKYLEAALAAADALAQHVRDVTVKGDEFSVTQVHESPWPFRVNARTGVVIDAFTANVIEPIRLFDELLRMDERSGLSDDRRTAYQRARDLAWDWLFSKNGPMVSYVWNGYFEDVPSDPQLGNRVQNIPMETARYLLKQSPPGVDIDRQVLALLHWVKAAFGEPGEPSINEQTWCYVPMGSHTARYASIQALMFERSGDVRHREEAYEHFNWATYSTATNGVVSVGPRWTGTWWSDGYGDYLRHFFEGMAAVPEWAPAGENHLLRSSSVVQQIAYAPTSVTYRTFALAGRERLRLTSRPHQVSAGGRALPEGGARSGGRWSWRPLPDGGGVLDVERVEARDVTVEL